MFNFDISLVPVPYWQLNLWEWKIGNFSEYLNEQLMNQLGTVCWHSMYVNLVKQMSVVNCLNNWAVAYPSSYTQLRIQKSALYVKNVYL